MKKFVLQNCKIVTSKEIFEGYVVVDNGKIEKMGRGLLTQDEKKTLEVIDLSGKYLLPGLIDVHVHFRTPGMTQKEDWTTGSQAALAGGVTTVFDMPNTVPPTIDQAALNVKREIVKKEALVNYGFFAGATKTNLKDLAPMKGIVGIKVYMGSSTGNLLVDDVKTLEALMESAGENEAGESSDVNAAENAGSNLQTLKGKILALHAENESCIQHGLQEYAGQNNPAVHSQIRAPECAEQAVQLALELVKKYRARVHICHASTRKEIELIRRFKKEQPAEIAELVSVEVTPHHLFLSEKAYASQGNIVKVNPPLRSEDDVQALWEGIADGTVDMIATDHAPHLMEEKKLLFAQAPSGVPGVQTMLPLLLNAVNEGKITLQKVAELCCFHPARRFGLKGKGRIEESFDADFTVIDLGLAHKINSDFMFTKTHWSPFEGLTLKGCPVATYIAGTLMYEWPDVFGKQLGREVQL